MYLHYIHIGNSWYYFFSESKSNKILRPYEGDGSLDGKLVLLAEGITKSQVRKLLKSKFPSYESILTYPYHQGPRTKNGSRPIKVTFSKDNYKKKRDFWKKRR